MTTAAPTQQELPSVQDSSNQELNSRAILLPVDDTDVRGRVLITQLDCVLPVRMHNILHTPISGLRTCMPVGCSQHVSQR